MMEPDGQIRIGWLKLKHGAEECVIRGCRRVTIPFIPYPGMTMTSDFAVYVVRKGDIERGRLRCLVLEEWEEGQLLIGVMTVGDCIEKHLVPRKDVIYWFGGNKKEKKNGKE